MTNSKFQLKIYISETFDPWFNIATEDWIFRDISAEELENTQILYLWRNDRSVIIGRFQNPWSECNTEKMEIDQVKLARRQSGGGAVYHDLGNTNFTFLSSKKNFNKQMNNSIIINAVNSFGLNASASGRNDLIISDLEGEKKFSGSAFKETPERSFHHGTLLINADMNSLSKYLNPHPKKLQSKGITSVRARVVNLADLNPGIKHQLICDKIIEEFVKTYSEKYSGGVHVSLKMLDQEFLTNQPKLRERFNQMSDWNWRFGEAPQFNHHISEYFSWGLIDVHLDVHKATVTKAQIFSDSLHPEMIEHLMASLNNIPYTKDAFSNAIRNVQIELPMISDYLSEFEKWILKEIS